MALSPEQDRYMQRLFEALQDNNKTLGSISVSLATTQASTAATQSAVATMQADISEIKTNQARLTERLDNHKDGCEDRHEPISARMDMLETQMSQRRKQEVSSDSSANAAVEISKSSSANMTAVVVAIISLLGTATMALSQFLK